MIKIITTNTSNAGMNAVIDQLAKNDCSKGHHIVVVPDAHALSAERVIFDRLNLKGSMNIEVVSFMRFASKILGNKIGTTLTKQGAVLFFKRVINKYQDQLVHYHKASLTDGFAGEMYAVISSVRNNGITVKDFEESLLKLSGTTLNKAKDILLLYREYLKELVTFTDSTTRLEAFVGEIALSKKIEESFVYLYGFDSLSEKQIEIISALSKFSKGVTISLMKTNNGANKELYPVAVLDRLIYKLQEQKIEYEIDDGVFEGVKEPFNTLNRNLFTITDASLRDVSQAVVLFKERDCYEQYNAVAREIIRLVRREGLRFKDVAVINCGESAQTDFKEILLRYGVPYFMDERYPLSLSLFAKFIIAVLDVARQGYKLDKVRTLIKNPLFSNDLTAVADFENYIVGENVSFDDFKKPMEECYESYRQRIIALCAPFERDRRVDYFVEHVLKLMESEENLALFEDALTVEDVTLRPLNEQSVEKIKFILKEYSQLVGDEIESPLGFKKMLTSSFEAEEIALIPRCSDAVYVGTLRESCIIRQKALFVIGATSDKLPVQHGFKAIVSPLDMDRLLESGVRLYPTPLDRIREERFAFIDLITKTDKLYIGYPEVAPDSTQNKPSEVIKDVQKMLNKKVISLNEIFLRSSAHSLEGMEDAVGHRNNAFYTLTFNESGLRIDEGVKGALYATLNESEVAVLDKKESREEKVPLLYTFTDDLHTKVTQLEQYFTCPYRHFLQFGLGLQERKEGKLRLTDVGTFVHEVLERYFRDTLGILRDISQEERERIADKAIAKVFDSKKLNYLKNDASVSYLIERLKSESKRTVLDLSDNVLKGNFDPTYIELEFSTREGAVPPVKFHTPYGDVAFHGKIDRVDTAVVDGKNSAIAIDYKTGSTKSDLNKVYYGEKLQLYLYLLVLRDVLNVAPVGSFYMPIRSGYRAKGRSYRFEGQIVLTDEIVKALDKNAYENAKTNGKKTQPSDVLPLNIKYKDGKIESTSTKNKLSEEEMAVILRYVRKVIPLAIKEIGEGYLEKVPAEGSCEHCSFRQVCGGAKEGMEREISSVNSPLKVKFEDEGESDGD